MADKVIIKRCFHCKQIKPISEFYKSRNRKDGHSTFCKMCGIKRAKNFRESKIGQLYIRNYHLSERNRLLQKKYRLSEKGKSSNSKSVEKQRRNFPEKRNASIAVMHAISAGKIVPANKNTCAYCFRQAKHYHHYLGYAKEHWLDVIPLCCFCHNKLHH